MRIFTLLFLIVVAGLLLVGCKNNSSTYKYDFYDLFKDGLVAVEKNDRWGYINKEGEVAIEFLYDDAASFYKGHAIVKSGNQFFLIDKEGDSVLDNKYDYLYRDFETGLLIYEKNEKFGLMTVEDEKITDALYDDIGNFSDGLAWIQNGEEYGYINEEGDIIISIQYTSANTFKNGLAVVEKDEKYGVINNEGDIVIYFLYDSIGTFDDYGNVRASITVINGLESITSHYLLDDEGNILLHGESIVGYGPIYGVKDSTDSWFLYKTDGTKFSSIEYSYIWYCENYTVNAETNYEDDDNIWFNEDSTIYQKASYDISYFDEDYIYTEEIYFVVEDDEDYINVYTIDSQYRFNADEFGTFLPGGLFIIGKNGKYGIVNENGDIEIEFLYDFLIYSGDNFIIYEVNNSYGIMDSEFKIIITADYDYINVNINISD